MYTSPNPTPAGLIYQLMHISSSVLMCNDENFNDYLDGKIIVSKPVGLSNGQQQFTEYKAPTNCRAVTRSKTNVLGLAGWLQAPRDTIISIRLLDSFYRFKWIVRPDMIMQGDLTFWRDKATHVTPEELAIMNRFAYRIYDIKNILYYLDNCITQEIAPSDNHLIGLINVLTVEHNHELYGRFK